MLQHRPARLVQWRGVTHTGSQPSDALRERCRLVSHSSRHYATPSVLSSLGRQSPLKRRPSLTASAAGAARDGAGERAEAWASDVSTSGQASAEAAAEQDLDSTPAAAAVAGSNPSNGDAAPSTSAEPSSGAAPDSSGGSSSVSATAGAASALKAESWWYSRHDHDIWGLAVPALFRCSLSLCTPGVPPLMPIIVPRLGEADA